MLRCWDVQDILVLDIYYLIYRELNRFLFFWDQFGARVDRLETLINLESDFTFNWSEIFIWWLDSWCSHLCAKTIGVEFCCLYFSPDAINYENIADDALRVAWTINFFSLSFVQLRMMFPSRVRASCHGTWLSHFRGELHLYTSKTVFVSLAFWRSSDHWHATFLNKNGVIIHASSDRWRKLLLFGDCLIIQRRACCIATVCNFMIAACIYLWEPSSNAVDASQMLACGWLQWVVNNRSHWMIHVALIRHIGIIWLIWRASDILCFQNSCSCYWCRSLLTLLWLLSVRQMALNGG